MVLVHQLHKCTTLRQGVNSKGHSGGGKGMRRLPCEFCILQTAVSTCPSACTRITFFFRAKLGKINFRTYWLPLSQTSRSVLVARYLFTLETEFSCRIGSSGLCPTGHWHWRQSCEPNQPRRACCLPPHPPSSSSWRTCARFCGWFLKTWDRFQVSVHFPGRSGSVLWCL